MGFVLALAHPGWPAPSPNWDPWPVIGAIVVLILLTRSFGLPFGVLSCAIAVASGPVIATSVDTIGIAPTLAALLVIRWVVRDALRRRLARPPDHV